MSNSSELETKLIVLSILLKNEQAIKRYADRQESKKQAWQAMARTSTQKRAMQSRLY